MKPTLFKYYINKKVKILLEKRRGYDTSDVDLITLDIYENMYQPLADHVY